MQDLFQYILCYGSTYLIWIFSARPSHFNTSYVTVQPRLTITSRWFHQISIHPMLRFNYRGICTCGSVSRISIHPMLRFNNLLAGKTIGLTIFQYILCYGSTDAGAPIGFSSYNFNTSYVTVQQRQLSKNSKSINISIHPMLRFNETFLPDIYIPVEFQYILCYGSTKPKTSTLGLFCDFNTSYVTVQQLAPKLIRRAAKNFNTSYVTVQHLK